MSVYALCGPGARVGPYTIVCHLKSGGMGDVYIARSPGGERVALKVLNDRSAFARERFAREGRVASRLDHPHVVRVLDWNCDGDLPYAVMELLEGQDLEARLGAARLTPPQALALAAQVCDALDHAHGLRVVHRDLKPANIFLCEGSEVCAKVLDFGIARVQDEVGMTRTGGVLGTVAYMSPEQAHGARDIDARSDVWSLGVVLYECLAGRPPFVAATAPGVLFQIATAAPPDLAKLRPDLPREVVRVVHRALSKARDERFASARAMRDALDAARRGDAESPIGGAAPAPSVIPAEDDPAAEARLASVVYLSELKDHALIGDLAARFGGRVVSLRADTLLVVFGADVWQGDEPTRAVRFARAASLAARRVSVATGRATRTAEGLMGGAVDAAVQGAAADGVAFDHATAALARERHANAEESIQDTQGAPEGTPLTPFVGREFELSLLGQAVEDAETTGRPAAVLVTGPEGMGKSRLLHEALARLQTRPAGKCLLARCEAHRRDTPFAAIGQALEGVADPAITSVFTEPSRRADPQVGIDHALAVFQSVVETLSARGAVTLAIDDAQWLDASSSALLRGFYEADAAPPLALWFFTRPEGRDALAGVHPGATARELSALPRPSAERLLRAVVGDVPEEVLERAGGHPLFLEQLGRLYAERATRAGDGPPDELPLSVQGAVLAQLDRLPPGEREFAKRAAVFGNLAWIRGVVALGGDAQAVPGLRRAAVLVPRPRSRLDGEIEVAFRSHLVREVAYGLWTALQRARLHALAAAWWEAVPQADPEELALHFESAGEGAKAAHAHVAIARRAARVGDIAAVRAHAARALELSDDVALRWEAAAARDDALQLTPDRDLQREGLAELEALAAGLTARHKAEAAWRRCYFSRITSEYADAELHGYAAVAYAAEAGDPRVGASANVELALLDADQARHEEAHWHAIDARGLAEESGDVWLLARAKATLGYVLAESGALAEAREAYAEASEAFRRAGDLRRAAVIENNAGSVLMQLGRLAEAEVVLDAARETARRSGNRAAGLIATHNRGVVRRMRGDFVAAWEAQGQAAEGAAGLKHTRLLSAIATERVYLALAEGRRREDLVELVRTALASAEATRAPPLVDSARAVAARARFGQDGTGVGVTEDLRARATAAKGAAARAELFAALVALDGGRPDDRAALRAAFERSVEKLDDDDRAACKQALARRVLADEQETET